MFHLKKILRIVGMYSLYIVAHYVAANVYQQVCVPRSWIGFLTSPFATTLPQCQALRWIVYNTGNYITAMWVLFGVWLLNIFTNYGPFRDEDQCSTRETRRRTNDQHESQDKTKDDTKNNESI